jgi:hypothetical protein
VAHEILHAATILAMTLGCTVARLPPDLPDSPPLPVRALPPSDVAGHGRVLLDVVGPPAQVEMVQQRDYPWGTEDAIASEFSGGLETTRGELVRPACERTPCILDMPFGTYEFRFTQGERRDTAFVAFGFVPSVAVHAVGDRRPGSVALSVCGGILAAASVVTIPLGSALAVTAPPPDSNQDPGDRRVIGLATAAIGVIAALGAVACLRSGSARDSSGPVRQWPVSGPP